MAVWAYNQAKIMMKGLFVNAHEWRKKECKVPLFIYFCTWTENIETNFPDFV